MPRMAVKPVFSDQALPRVLPTPIRPFVIWTTLQDSLEEEGQNCREHPTSFLGGTISLLPFGELLGGKEAMSHRGLKELVFLSGFGG